MGGVVSMTSLVVAGGLHRTPRASAAVLPGWPCPGVRSSPRPKVPAVAGSASTSRRATAPITVAHDAAAEDAEVDARAAVMRSIWRPTVLVRMVDLRAGRALQWVGAAPTKLFVMLAQGSSVAQAAHRGAPAAALEQFRRILSQ